MLFNPAKHSITVATALAGVIALIYGLAFLAKKLKANNFINKDLNIESVMHLNNKIKLMIVNIANERILLGVTHDSVTKLSDLVSFKKSIELNHDNDDDGDSYGRERCLKDSC
jgi:flagellar biogenesis protein FliO